MSCNGAGLYIKTISIIITMCTAHYRVLNNIFLSFLFLFNEKWMLNYWLIYILKSTLCSLQINTTRCCIHFELLDFRNATNKKKIESKNLLDMISDVNELKKRKEIILEWSCVWWSLLMVKCISSQPKSLWCFWPKWLFITSSFLMQHIISRTLFNFTIHWSAIEKTQLLSIHIIISKWSPMIYEHSSLSANLILIWNLINLHKKKSIYNQQTKII